MCLSIYPGPQRRCGPFVVFGHWKSTTSCLENTQNTVTSLSAGLSKFHQQPSPQRVNVGGAARFECQVEGVPTPVITWEKDKAAVPQEARWGVGFPAFWSVKWSQSVKEPCVLEFCLFSWGWSNTKDVPSATQSLLNCIGMERKWEKILPRNYARGDFLPSVDHLHLLTPALRGYLLEHIPAVMGHCVFCNDSFKMSSIKDQIQKKRTLWLLYLFNDELMMIHYEAKRGRIWISVKKCSKMVKDIFMFLFKSFFFFFFLATLHKNMLVHWWRTRVHFQISATDQIPLVPQKHRIKRCTGWHCFRTPSLPCRQLFLSAVP